MQRLTAAVATSLLVFFSVTFAVRFSESFVSDGLRAQLSQPQIQYLPDSFGSELKDIYPGPDGNIWVMSDDTSRAYDLGVAQKILRVKPDGTMASSFPLDAQAFEFRGQIFGGKLWLLSFVFDYLDDGVHQEQRDNLISVAPDGSVTSHRSYRTRTKMGPDGAVTQTYIDGVETSRNVDYISWIWEYFPGPDGFLWAESEGNWYKVSPSGEFTPFTITPPSLPGITPAAPNRLGGPGLSKGGDGNMWDFFEGYDSAGKRSLYYVSITPQGISTPYPIPDLYGANDGTCSAGGPFSGYPSRLTLGSDGNMWYSYVKFSCTAGTWTYEGKIGKILHDGTMQTYALPNKIFAQGDGSYYHQGVAMVAGPDGKVWFMYSDSSTTPATNGIGNITPDGGVSLIPTPGYIPSRIASGADGNIWFVTRPDYNDSGSGYSKVKIGKVALTSAPVSSIAQSTGRSSAVTVTGVASYSSRQSSSAFVAGNRCGNEVLNSGETCDDGNMDNGDGCSSSCTLERGYSCSGTYCYVVCGDGIVMRNEQCDDNNRRSGDGCSAVCLVEAQGVAGTSTNTAASSTCGNGTLNTGETCDDANRASGDGCSASCTLEDGYSCYLTACAPVCGDGKTKGAEGCDDGNRRNGDGCTDYCRPEAGYSCVGTVCSVSCGDGIPLGNEQCDDGNARSGDGCSACAVETGWYCGGRPSQCYRYPTSGAGAASSAAASVSDVSSASPSPSSSAVSSSASSSSSSKKGGIMIFPDWNFNPSSRSVASVAFFSKASSVSDSSESASSESSGDSSEDVSSESSSSQSSVVVPACGNGVLEEGEECDAGSLNGSPVTQCGADCVMLKPAASESSVSSQAASASQGGSRNPVMIMILVALAIAVIGGIVAYFWFKFQQAQER